MLKLILAGAWSCFIALGGVYATQEFRKRGSLRPSGLDNRAVETRKTREINVPKIAQGAIKGYVVVSFAFVVDLSLLGKGLASPDAFIVEEAFRGIYDDDTIDFSNPKKYDFRPLNDRVRANVNARLKYDVVVDVILQELHFIPSADLKQKM